MDCVWELTPVYGHFGLNVVGGANGSSFHTEFIHIEDVTTANLRVMTNWVDVRDFGARGDGVFNNKNAYKAADAAANGRQVLLPAGDYFVGADVTLNSRFRFEGRILMAQDDQLNLVGGLRYSIYLDAFKDERLALEKALQTLINFNDHDSLDLERRVINLDAPLNVQAAVANRLSFTTRRAIRNGKFAANSNGDWSEQSFTRNADYVSGGTELTGVNNARAIPRSSLIAGDGLGQEV